MSTVEDRLTRALAARADLVQPEDLRATLVHTGPSVLRRPATYLLAAAACAAAVAVPFVLSGDGEGRNQPAPPPATQTPEPTPPADVEGADWPEVRSYNKYDVDGDGSPDSVVTRTESGDNVTQEPWRVEARLSSGGTYAVILDGTGWGINPIGPVDLDGDGGDEILYYNGLETEEIGVLDLVGPALADLAVPADPGITTSYTDHVQAWWLRDRTLFTSTSVMGGSLPADDSTSLPPEYAVDVYRWQLADGELQPVSLGRQCVRGVRPKQPFACEGGEPNPFINLFPDVTDTVGIGEEFALDFDGGGDDPIVLENVSGQPIDGEIGEGDVELVMTLSNGGEVRAAIPAGWQPELFTTPVSSREVPLLLVRQEGGDSTTLTAFQFWNGELRVMPVVGDVPLGSGFFGEGDTPYPFATWLAEEDGALYTRVPTEAEPDSTSFDVWRWTTDGEELATEELGRVCIDFATTPVEAEPC